MAAADFIIDSVAVVTLTDPSTLTGTYTAVASFKYNTLCTNFTHDITNQQLTGKALLTGDLYAHTYSSGSIVESTSLTGFAPPLTLTVQTATLSGTAPTFSGNVSMAGSLLPTILSSLETASPITSMTGFVSASLALVGSNVSGSMAMTFLGIRSLNVTTTLPAVNNIPFDMTRGGSCGV